MAVSKILFQRGGQYQAAGRIDITVILENFEKYKEKSDTNEKLARQCLNVLVNQFVKCGDRLELKKSRLAKMYGVSNVVINACYLKDHSEISDSVIVNYKTKVVIQSHQSTDFYRLKTSEIPSKLGGLDHELRKLCRVLNLCKIRHESSCQTPVGVLLHGPPGCGKTSLVKALSHHSNSVLMTAENTDLLQSDFGSGADTLRDIFKKAERLSSEGSVILFIDEIETLCPSHDNASLGNRQLTNALASEMDRITSERISSLLVVASTNSVSSVHKSLRRPGRFDLEVLISVPSKTQRESILQVATQSLYLGEDVTLSELAMKTPGFVGADLKALCEEAASHSFERLESFKANKKDNCVVAMSDFSHALHIVVPSLRKSLSCQVDIQPVKWEEIGGLDDIKEEMRQSIEWPLLHPESLERFDITATKGILLYGPPGCCKTTLVRAAATSSHVTFLSLNGAQVYSPYVGESERIISEAFQRARALSPSILFLDEIDSLVGTRSSSNGRQSRVQERILATMLNEMDGVGTRLDEKSTKEESGPKLPHGESMKQRDDDASMYQPRHQVEDSVMQTSSHRVIVIGATNRPDMLDAALLRPGRLDRHIYVPLPDLQGRRSILEVLTKKMATDFLGLEILSEKTELYSGADLTNLCREAGLVALRQAMATDSLDASKLQVSQEHFEAALGVIKPSLSNKNIHFYSKRSKLK